MTSSKVAGNKHHLYVRQQHPSKLLAYTQLQTLTLTTIVFRNFDKHQCNEKLEAMLR